MRSCPGKGASWAIRADTHVCWRESLGTFRFMERGRWKSTRLSCPLRRGQNDPKQCPESRRLLKAPGSQIVKEALSGSRARHLVAYD